MSAAPEVALAAPIESRALEDLLIADAADGAWLDRLASDIRMLADGEHREAHLKLNPPSLGDMDIRLDLDGRNARVHFTVETAAAQTLIADGASRLATLVEANGLKLDGATVDLGQGRREEREPPADHAEPFHTQPRTPRAAPPELARAVARTRIAAGYERYA